MSATEPGEWLTLSAAASRLGWARARVESRARREEWPKRQPNRGTALEYLVPASVLTEPQTTSDGAAAAPGTERDVVGDGAMAEALAELQREVTELATVAASAKGELAAEMRRSADLAATLAAERARGDRLEAALAEARRPWLARVLDGLRRR